MNGKSNGQGTPSGSFWDAIPQAPPDGLLSITLDYLNDPHPDKLNIGVGIYRTGEGKSHVLDVVQKVEKQLAELKLDKDYLSVSGDAEFCELSRKLAFGNCPRGENGSIVTFQSVSGSGSLRVGAEFLVAHHCSKVIYLTDPAWDNYTKIFPRAGLDTRHARYFDYKTKGLDFEGFMEDLQNAEPGAVVVLQTCAHNPTGVDPTKEQWQQILEVMKARHLLPFFDSAYQGFATGDLEDDVWSLRLFEQAGMEMLFCHSFSKNMSLYAERAGCLSVVCSNADQAKRVDSQLRAIIRPMYATPPKHGARIASMIMRDPGLTKEWKAELKLMSERIRGIRKDLYAALKDRKTPGEWECIIKQIGMFAYVGLTTSQAKYLTSKWHIYLPTSGRISMAGLSSKTIGYLADAMDDAVRNVQD